MNTQIAFGKDARHRIFNGARMAAEAVVATLGPAGRNIVISRPDGSPMITKDGVTVAESIKSFEDPFEDMGLRMIKEAARNTNKTGDGTTTATLLTYEMMRGGIDVLEKGSNAIHVKRGMDKAKDAIVQKLESMSVKIETVDQLAAVATLSCQDKELGAIVAKTVYDVGQDGAVMIERSAKRETKVEVTDGFQIGVGYSSEYFARNGKAVVRDPFVLVTSEKIVSIRDLTPVLDAIRKQLDANPASEGEPIRLVIFSAGVDGDAFSTLAKAAASESEALQCIVLNPPYFGARQRETLEDIAIVTGASLIDKKSDGSVSKVKITDLGTCESVLATRNATTIVGQHGNKATIHGRVEMLKTELDKAEEEDKTYLRSRIAGMSGKIANIQVGGSSAMEVIEKFHRVEDAVSASRAAFDSGILPGGGTALIRCESVEIGELNEDERKGADVVINSLHRQAHLVALNAGENPVEVVNTIRAGKDDYGFNAESREYGNMFDMNVVDPCLVPIEAMKNAVSVAGMFLTTEASIYNPENA